MKRMTSTILLLVVLPIHASGSDHWPQFRGPNATGVADNPNLPERWTMSENVDWKRELPGRGWSSPVVWGERVFLTTVVNEEEAEEPKKGLYFGGDRPEPPTATHHWKVYCLDLGTGAVIWEKLLHSGAPLGPLHIKNSYASETPVTDGEHLYVYFGNLGLFCLSFGGDVVWSQMWQPHATRYGWGTAASPVLSKDRLYIVNDNEEESYLVALDKKSGNQIWRVWLHEVLV